MSALWKWILVLVVAGLLSFLLVRYVPSTRFWQKQKTEAVASVDTITALNIKIRQIEQRERDKANRIATAVRIQQAGKSGVVPNIKLAVADLSSVQRELSILKSLVRSGYLRQADTSSREKVTAATAVALTVCDTVMVQDTALQVAYATLQGAYNMRGDSLDAYQRKERTGAEIASERGLFTGKNRRLRKWAKEPIKVP